MTEIGDVQTTPYEWLEALRACYKDRSDQSKYIKRVPDLEIIDQTIIHGFKMLCLHNNRTNENFVALRGSTKWTQWFNQDIRSALGSTPHEVTKRVQKTYEEWLEKFGHIDFGVSHSQGADFLRYISIPQVAFNPHVTKRPTENMVFFRLNQDLLTRFLGKNHCDVVGTGGHSLKDWEFVITPTTALSDLNPLRFYTTQEWRLTELVSDRLKTMDQELCDLDEKIKSYIEERKGKSSHKSKEPMTEELSKLNTEFNSKKRAYRLEEAKVICEKNPALKEQVTVISDKEAQINQLFEKKDKVDEESKGHLNREIGKIEAELKPLYEELVRNA